MDYQYKIANSSEKDSNKDSEKKSGKQDFHKFLRFNIIILGITVFLGLANKYIPKSNMKITSTLLLNHIFPLLYFAIFSFLFGAIFLIGDKNMRPYLLDHFSNKTLDIGITASYAGAVGIILSVFIKNIIQKALNITIKSSPVHDLVGFLIGRVILLTLVEFHKI